MSEECKCGITNDGCLVIAIPVALIAILLNSCDSTVREEKMQKDLQRVEEKLDRIEKNQKKTPENAEQDDYGK